MNYPNYTVIVIAICCVVYYGLKRWLEHKEILAGKRPAKEPKE